MSANKAKEQLNQIFSECIKNENGMYFSQREKVSRIYFTKDNDEHFNLNIERDFSDYIFQEILNIFQISNKTTKSIHEVVHNINGKDYKIIGAFSALSGKSTDVTLKFIS